MGWEGGVRSSEEAGLGVSTVLLEKISPTSADSPPCGGRKKQEEDN